LASEAFKRPGAAGVDVENADVLAWPVFIDGAGTASATMTAPPAAPAIQRRRTTRRPQRPRPSRNPVDDALADRRLGCSIRWLASYPGVRAVAQGDIGDGVRTINVGSPPGGFRRPCGRTSKGRHRALSQGQHIPPKRKVTPMKRRIAASIASAFRAGSHPENVHFHVDSGGRAFVCDYDRCESPALAPHEVRLIDR
jgi:hypothetical protein